MTVLDIVFLALILAWLSGFVFKFAGKLIHLLLLLAVIVLLVRLMGVGS